MPGVLRAGQCVKSQRLVWDLHILMAVIIDSSAETLYNKYGQTERAERVLAYNYRSILKTRIPILKADQKKRGTTKRLSFRQKFTEVCHEHETAIIETINFGLQSRYFTDVIKSEELGDTIRSTMENLFNDTRAQISHVHHLSSPTLPLEIINMDTVRQLMFPTGFIYVRS